jgi:tRNA pseudouridine55 synthase
LNDGGVLLIDKPVGPTSHDVVQQVRRKLKTRRVGHAGTLDPQASGLLIVCVGDATRVLEYMTSADKSYCGDIVFGTGTDTDDASGQVIESKSAQALTEEQVQAAVEQLTGRIDQVVPAFSAVHIDGKRAYELARAGQQVELPSREVEIFSFSMDSFRREAELLHASFRVKCSKGTYIRALCRDAGKLVQIPAHMRTLCRTSSGLATLNDAMALDDFLESSHPESCLLKPLQFLEQAKLTVGTAVLEKLANGQRVPLAQITNEDDHAVNETILVCSGGDLALIAEVCTYSGQKQLQPKKVFWKRG